MKKVWVSYRKLPSGNWKIRFRRRGKPERGIILPKTVRESSVKKKAAWWEEEINMGRENPWDEAPDSYITVEEAVSEYIAVHERHDWSEAHRYAVNARLKKMQDYISSRAKLQNVQDWNWFIDANGTAHSKEDYFSTTRAFLNWCKRQNYLQEFDVSLPLQIRKELKRKEIKYITWQQLKTAEQYYYLLRAKNARFDRRGFEPERHTRMWWVMFWQGLRREEAAKIRHADVKNNQIRVDGKGGSIDWIPVVPPARDHIKWFSENKISDRLFGFKAMQSPYRQFNRVFTESLNARDYSEQERSRIIKELSLKQKDDELLPPLQDQRSSGFHQLRHGGAVHYLTLGKPLIFVSKLLRHADTGITSRVYADIIRGMEGSAFDDIKDEPV